MEFIKKDEADRSITRYRRVRGDFSVLYGSCSLPDTLSSELQLTATPEEGGSIVLIDDALSGAPASRGTRLLLEAQPADGWTFLRWSGVATGTENPLRIDPSRTGELAAVFAPRTNFLVYMAADNNLESFATLDLHEMEQAGAGDGLEVLILLDIASRPGTGLYRIVPDSRGTGFTRELVKEFGELDMGNPDTLRDFLVTTAQLFPARTTVLTLWNHGSGVYPRGIAGDSSTPPGAWGEGFNCLTTDEIALALREARSITGVKPDLIHMDACLMQLLEVVRELSDETGYIVASQADVPVYGNEYARLLRTLRENPGSRCGITAWRWWTYTPKPTGPCGMSTPRCR